MIGDLVSFTTRDGVELSGFYVSAKGSKKCLIFIHGLSASFLWRGLWKGMPETMATVVKREGWNLLSFNNRGSNMINRLMRKGKKVTMGGAKERFEDCVKDIDAAIRYARKRGSNTIVLMGHSTGCQKSIYYQSKTRERRVNGIVLLAPASDRDYEMKKLGKRFAKTLRLARHMMKTGKGDHIMDQWKIPLTAKRYWNLHKPSSAEGGIFNYGTGKMSAVSRINVPTLAVYGSRDKYSVYGPKRELAMIGNAIHAPYQSAIIKNAKHGFESHEREVAALVGKWLRSLK